MNIDILLGKTIRKIEGANLPSEKIFIKTSDGKEYKMYHRQDCCESVYLEDVAGDITDLINSPILVAEEIKSDENPPGINPPEYQDCYQWTFYKLSTIKGSVTLRWYGDSNGYYSTDVDFEEVK